MKLSEKRDVFIMKTLVFKSIALLCVAMAGYASAQSNKLDAALTSRLHQMASSQAAHYPRSVEMPSDVMVTTSIVFSGDILEALKSKGVRIRSVIGSVALVNIPLGQISAVASMPGVLRIETPSKPMVRLDKSISYVGVDKLRTKSANAGWAGSTGKGVLIGIIDTGIDLQHADFRRADGTTRVLRLWNQRSGLNGATPPTGEDGLPLYGADCDAAAINAALSSVSGHNNPCNPKDTGGHGTHVAGIAAGNGNGTGRSMPSGRFVGVAPEADLLVANSLDAAIDKSQSDPFLDALAWMRKIAQSRQQPLVINLSLGSYFGSRDGTGTTEKAIDGISGPGLIVVAAAGNEGNVPIRKEFLPMRTGDTVSADFQIPLGRTSEKLEFWGNGGNRYAVQLVCPKLTTPTPWTTVAQQSDVLDGECGKIEVTITDVNSLNGDRQYAINLSNGQNTLATGDWSLKIRADSITAASEKLGIISGEDNQGATFKGTFDKPIHTGIVTDTGSARKAITVAAINTSYSWRTASGLAEFEPTNGELYDIATFSSTGPRRICSAQVNECLNPVMKPEIAAPGSFIVSSMSATIDAKELPKTNEIEEDGVHYALMGTSMAAPHVTGAVALMLQVDPLLTPERAKQILFSSVQSSSFSKAAQLPVFDKSDMPPNPNYAWGYGPMSACNALNVMPGFAQVSCNGVATSTTTTTSTTSTTTSTTATMASPTTTTLQSGSNSTVPASIVKELSKGWNLVGNSYEVVLDVAQTFGNKSLVTSVWKWLASKTAWAFYAPSMTSEQLQAYALAKGYEVLSAIQPGEGYWVNANGNWTLSIMPSSSVMQVKSQDYVANGKKELPKGWSLIATGDNVTPSELHLILGQNQPAVIPPVFHFTSLWAWDSGMTNWIFYAPSLQFSGALEGYASQKGYQTFGDKTIAPSVGFWVNK